MKDWKLWNFMGWDTKEARNERESIKGFWGLMTWLIIVSGMCTFAYIIWG